MASLKTRYGSYADELATATGRRKILLGFYMDVVLGVHNLFESLLVQQKGNPGLTPQTVWHTPITFHNLSLATAKFEQIQHLDDNMTLLHGVKSGEGGKVKAARVAREREQALKSIQPLFRELKKVRLSGKYKTCEEAVTEILANNDRFADIAAIVYSDPPVLSYDHIFMPEAKKAWRDAVKSTPSKKPSKK